MPLFVLLFYFIVFGYVSGRLSVLVVSPMIQPLTGFMSALALSGVVVVFAAVFAALFVVVLVVVLTVVFVDTV